MQARKLIVIDEDLDAKLGAVCGAALKSSGIKMLQDVNLLIRSITEESEDDQQSPFVEDYDEV